MGRLTRHDTFASHSGKYTHTHTRAEECNYQLLLITNQLLIVFVTHRLCLLLLLALVSVTMYTMKVYRYYPVTSDD